MSEKRIFKCVPLNNSWYIQGTKDDLKAMYRRPRRSIDEFDQVVQERGPDGRPLWDLVGPLPLRRHSDWIAKGFEYVTVVSRPQVPGDGWPAVAAWLRSKELEPRDYLQHPQLGTWNPKLYISTADQADVDQFAALRALVERLGSDAVLDVKRSTDPSFTLPEQLRNIPPGGLKKAGGGTVLPHEEAAGPAPVSQSAQKRVAAQKKAAAAKAPVAVEPPAEVRG